LENTHEFYNWWITKNSTQTIYDNRNFNKKIEDAHKKQQQYNIHVIHKKKHTQRKNRRAEAMTGPNPG